MCAGVQVGIRQPASFHTQARGPQSSSAGRIGTWPSHRGTLMEMPPPCVTVLGTYRTPRFKSGNTVTCEVRGEVTVTGLANARTPWPVGKRRGSRGRALVVYSDLVEALKRESRAAICHWWGVSPATV